MKPNYPKLIFAVLMSIYFLWIAYAPLHGSFLDLVDLPIHEFGHILFRLFGQFLMIAGGSLFQVIMPAIFVGYFWWNEKYYSAAIVFFWVRTKHFKCFCLRAGRGCDADCFARRSDRKRRKFSRLELSFDQTGLLSSTKAVAGFIRLFGTLCIITASVLSIKFSFSKE